MPQSPTCPCPGETQSSEQRGLSILVRPEQSELYVSWSATRFDGVRLNITSTVVNPRTSGVLVRMCFERMSVNTYVRMYAYVCMLISVDDVRMYVRMYIDINCVMSMN